MLTGRRPPEWLARAWELGGLAGMTLALSGAVVFGLAVGPWVQTLSDSFEVTSEALDVVDTTIEIVDDALVVFSETLVGVDGVFVQTQATLGETSRVVLTTAGLLTDDVPGQIESIQAAMDGLIDTANVVDGILGALSFVGVDYDPEVPLDEALSDVNQQLGELGTSLSDSAADLFSMTVSINRLNEEVALVGESLVGLEEQIDQSRMLIAEYRTTAGEAQAVVTEAADRLSSQVWLLRLLGVALLLAFVVGFSVVWWMGRLYRPPTETAA